VPPYRGKKKSCHNGFYHWLLVDNGTQLNRSDSYIQLSPAYIPFLQSQEWCVPVRGHFFSLSPKMKVIYGTDSRPTTESQLSHSSGTQARKHSSLQASHRDLQVVLLHALVKAGQDTRCLNRLKHTHLTTSALLQENKLGTSPPPSF
jgi:hypothetical protein